MPGVKLLAFSDLHRDLEQGARLVEMSTEADVVIGAGDFASVHEGLEETIAALAPIATPTVLVPGNNETVDALRDTVRGWEAATTTPSLVMAQPERATSARSGRERRNWMFIAWEKHGRGAKSCRAGRRQSPAK